MIGGGVAVVAPLSVPRFSVILVRGVCGDRALTSLYTAICLPHR